MCKLQKECYLFQFVFDSEAKPATKKDAIHNKLLTEIQGGVKLKKVQCNDRSRPALTGWLSESE